MEKPYFNDLLRKDVNLIETGFKTIFKTLLQDFTFFIDSNTVVLKYHYLSIYFDKL